jgi:divalent metal cation (Fe/Co/Zn/Cd) transporter
VSDHILGRRLQWATIAWNAAEVFVTIGLGVAAGSLALVAFGLDSLIEVFASLVVLWHMNPTERAEFDGADEHERTARDTRARHLVALAFAVLAAYLLIASTRTLWVGSDPDSSPIGIGYLAVTAVVMFTLARAKRHVGIRLASEPFLAEASMTLLDGFLATGILTALVLNTAFGWWWADPVAAILVGLVAANEAREGFE